MEPHAKPRPDQKAKWDEFWQRNIYVQGEYDKDEGFKKLEASIDDLRGSFGKGIINRLFYLALPPSVYEVVTKQIHTHCMSKT